MRRFLPALVLAACAARPSAPTTPPPSTPSAKTIELEPMRIDVVQTDNGMKSEIYDAGGLLDEGNDALLVHKYDDALRAYDHLITDFPDSKLVIPALYN